MSAVGRPGRRRRRGESGVALLIVLLVVSLLTVVVIELTYSAQVETHLALTARNALQATYLARSGINVAEAVLLYDRTLNSFDSEEDFWARPLPPLPIGDGVVGIRVRDEGRFLNINELATGSNTAREGRRQVFERLFEILGIDPSVLSKIVDWLDADDEPMIAPPGAEQSAYTILQPPVAVRNGPILTLRELLLVRGVTPEILRRLEEFVTALPPQNALTVNVNTADAVIFFAISPALAADPGLVERLIATRRTAAFQSISELGAIPGWDQVPAFNDQVVKLTTSSGYFRIEAVGQVNDAARGVAALVRREDRKLTRVAYRDSVANLSLTSQPPSDFLQSLPPLGSGGS